MTRSRITIIAPVISGAVSISLLALYNITYWRQIFPLVTPTFLLAIGLLICCCLYAVLTLVSSQYIYKPCLIFTLLVAALSAYTMDYYGYVISIEAFRNIIETDRNEAFALLNWPYSAISAYTLYYPPQSSYV